MTHEQEIERAAVRCDDFVRVYAACMHEEFPEKSADEWYVAITDYAARDPQYAGMIWRAATAVDSACPTSAALH